MNQTNTFEIQGGPCIILSNTQAEYFMQYLRLPQQHH